jgi:hypothetical protein
MRRRRLLIAWTPCVVGALCGGALAVFVWWCLPSLIIVRQANGAYRWMGSTLLGVGFLILVGGGIVVGAWVSRRFLSAQEFAALTRKPRDT